MPRGIPLHWAASSDDVEVLDALVDGEEELVVVVNDPVAFARSHVGQIEWMDALRSRAIEVKGSRTLARALPTWNTRGVPAPTEQFSAS